MSRLADALRAAKALIDAPEKWCQGNYAQDANGASCPWKDRNAVRFCSQGAINRTVGGTNWAKCGAALDSAMGGSTLTGNDTHDHAWVMAKFDEAIAAAERGE